MTQDQLLAPQNVRPFYLDKPEVFEQIPRNRRQYRIQGIAREQPSLDFSIQGGRDFGEGNVRGEKCSGKDPRTVGLSAASPAQHDIALPARWYRRSRQALAVPTFVNDCLRHRPRHGLQGFAGLN